MYIGRTVLGSRAQPQTEMETAKSVAGRCDRQVGREQMKMKRGRARWVPGGDVGLGTNSRNVQSEPP